MSKAGSRKFIAIFMVIIGIILLGMYAVLFFFGGRPSAGILTVGLVDLGVGVVLLRRATQAGAGK